MGKQSCSFFVQGQKLAKKGRYNQAIEQFEKSLARDPRNANTLFALGSVAQKIETLDIAEKMYRATLEVKPDSEEAAVNLGIVLFQQDKIDEAIEVYRQILMWVPQSAPAWTNLGLAVATRGDLASAETFYQEALKLKPRSKEALVNLSELKAEAGQYEAALELVEKALKGAPGDANLQFNRGELLMCLGRLKEGWRALEFRMRPGHSHAISHQHRVKPWRGENLAGKSILLSSEQGIADQIRFLNCVNDIVEKAERVVIEIEPRLVSMVARTFPGVEVLPYCSERRAGQTHFLYDWDVNKLDFATPMLSVFQYFRPSLDTFPDEGVRLKPADEERVRWQKATESGDDVKVGICWRGGARNTKSEKFYAPLEEWAPVFDVPGVRFFSLMYDECVNELNEIKERFGVEVTVFDGLDYKNDLEAILALSEQMDLVISAPSAPATLSGAVGVPTVVLSRHHWWEMMGTDVYQTMPSMRPIVQSNLGDWGPVIAEAAEVLHEIKKARP